jgi:squalene-hopene/tetraprenyl-beta-curcumene cyclase
MTSPVIAPQIWDRPRPHRGEAALVEAAARALARGTRRLLALQHERGYWKGELETNVTMDAEDVLMRQFLGIRRARETAASAAWIRSQQRSDGSFATFRGGPADLSTTIEAWIALRLAGDPPDALHMKLAAEVTRDLGGIEASRVFTRIWLALFGEWSWDALPVLPPELILLPPWFPLNIYDFGCWARQTIVPLAVVSAHRPRRPLGVELGELRTGRARDARLPLTSWGGRFQFLDRWLHRYEKRPLRSVRKTALALCIEWILKRQEADGGWGGIQPPWVYSLLALQLEGYALDHPAVARGIQGLDGFTIEENGTRRLEACQSPVWDTALALVALGDAGVPPGHPALARAAEWLLDQEIRVRGDWAVRRPALAPSGFAFEFENDNYPDIDDTAEVVIGLRRAGHPDSERVEAALSRSIEWTLGMQCRDGGFAAFDADNTRALCGELPFCDFGEVIDPPSADVTAHVIEMLALEGRAGDPRARAAIDWLLRAQEPDGSWFGRWGANYVYGTGAAVPALVRAGVAREHPAIRRALGWLESVQNGDGGFGEDLRSYSDPAWRGRGASTPSQTAWALLALLEAGAPADSIERALGWLVRAQRCDGGFDEALFTGTGFPGDFYIRYHLYAQHFPLMALGRYVRVANGSD